MSNSLAACELLGERRSNYSTANQHKFQHHHHHHITNDSLSPVASPLGCQLTMSTHGGGSLQLAAAAQNKRKEKARIAARARRSQEASIIMEIAAELEITQEKLRRIDKATIVKLAIDYMKAFEILCFCKRPASTSTTRLVLAPPMPARQRLALSYTTINNNKTTTNNHDTIASNITTSQTTTTRKQRRELFDSTQEEITRSSALHDDDDDNENQQDEDERENQQLNHQQDSDDDEQEEFEYRKPPLFSAPKLATTSIFAPKTLDNMNPHFLMIEEKDNGKASFVLKPDTEILDDDDLTHLAPQAGDISISLEADPLDGIPSDDLLMLSPKSSLQNITVFFNCTKAA